MNVTKVTFDNLAEGARYNFYSYDQQVAFSAQVDRKYYSIKIPSSEQLPGLILTKISLLGSYDFQLKLHYTTAEVTSLANLCDVNMFQIDCKKLPAEINKPIQEYL